MTSPAPDLAPTKRLSCWIWIVIALVVGIAVGWGMHVLYSKSVPRGSCVRPDSTMVADTISQQECQSVCPTCTWTQGN